MAGKNSLANVDTDSLLDRIQAGELLIDIAKSLDVSHDAVGKKLRKLIPAEYRQARVMGITVNLHKSRDAIRQASEDKDLVALACARESFKADSWFAEREAPEIYGNRTMVDVTTQTIDSAMQTDSLSLIGKLRHALPEQVSTIENDE